MITTGPGVKEDDKSTDNSGVLAQEDIEEVYGSPEDPEPNEDDEEDA
jgi:hypothetical protein